MTSPRPIRAIAAHEFRSAMRSRVLLVFVICMVVIAAGSITIASFDFRAQMADYNAYVQQAKAAGAASIPPPQLFPLQLLRGVIEYIQIIGAVLAIGLGYLAVARERTGGTLRLLATRPVRVRDMFFGRLLGATGLIGTVLAATAAISVLVVGVAGGQWLASSELIRLVIAFAFALIYMLLFFALGSWLTARSKNLANGLIVAIVVWLSLVLIVPQIGDTMDPDNQVPGGLFAALHVQKPDEKKVLAKFTTYERIRSDLEESSLTKHYERFTFAATGIKDKYNDKPLSLIFRDKRGDLGWLTIYVALSGGLMWFGLRRELSVRKETT